MGKRRNCEFMTMVATGERPDATIHMAAFEDGNEVNCVSQMEGTLGNHVGMVCKLVENMCNTLKEKGGDAGVAAFIDQLAQVIADNAPAGAIKMINDMNTPRGMREMLEELAKMVGFDPEEGDDE